MLLGVMAPWCSPASWALCSAAQRGSSRASVAVERQRASGQSCQQRLSDQQRHSQVERAAALKSRLKRPHNVGVAQLGRCQRVALDLLQYISIVKLCVQSLDCAGLVRLSVGGRVDDPRGTSAQDLGELEASIYKAQSVVRRHG
jgi:hypothetical protein